jgi:hypothetical protein
MLSRNLFGQRPRQDRRDGVANLLDASCRATRELKPIRERL